MQQFLLDFTPQRSILSVHELNAAIRDTLLTAFADVWVAGEISGVRLASSGHYYFTLKEEDASLRCVCFRMTARYLRTKPEDGLAVAVRGRIDVYEAKGEYQLIVETIERRGHGALQAAFDALKRKLSAEGLFDPARKKPLPPFPTRIGIITSHQGAVLHDLLQILERRSPGIHLRLYPASVQGESSIEELCEALEYFTQTDWAQLVILARGGGSLEDLRSFNSESVARAIAASPVPVISAVGHETDFTIADFVADLRAPTPSAAAELAVPNRDDLTAQLDTLTLRAVQQARYRLAMAQRRLHQQGSDQALALFRLRLNKSAQHLDELESLARERFLHRQRQHQSRLDQVTARLDRLKLSARFAAYRSRIDITAERAERLQVSHLATARSKFTPLEARLPELNPHRILERGYALVTAADGSVVKSPAQAPPGAKVQIRVAHGSMPAQVLDR